MEILCPSCGKHYDIPEKHLGRKFRCVKCNQKIKTSKPGPTPPPINPGSRSQVAKPPQYSKAKRFAKETGAPTPEAKTRIQMITVILLLVGLGGATLAIVESQVGFLKALGRNNSEVLASNEETETSDSDGESNPSSTTQNEASSDPRDLPVVEPANTESQNTRNENSNPFANPQSGSNANVEDTDDRGELSRLILPEMEDFRRKPILGGIPGFDPTWDTNHPNYAFRMLQQDSVNGIRVGRFSRVYGSPSFKVVHERLLQHRDFPVRFYSALALANFGSHVDDSLTVMLEGIATGRDRVGESQLRLDFANRLLTHYQDRVPQALVRLSRNRDPKIRGFAMEYLANMGVDAKPAATNIAQAVLDRRFYEPSDPKVPAATIADTAIYALRQLRENAIDAVPILLTKASEVEDEAVREKLKQTAVFILAANNTSQKQLEERSWERAIGLGYIPRSMNYVIHYKPSRLMNSNYVKQMLQKPRIEQAIELVESTCQLEAVEIDMVTVAYAREARSVWERKPIILVARTLSPINRARYQRFSTKDVAGKKYHQIPGDLGMFIAGERTLVFGTEDDLVSILLDQNQGPPNVVIPREIDNIDYFYATNTYAVSANFTNEINRLKVDFEHFLSDTASATETAYRSGEFDFPEDFPAMFADWIRDLEFAPAETEQFGNATVESPVALVRANGSRLSVSGFAPAQYFLDQFDPDIVFVEWMAPETTKPQESWAYAVTRMDTLRAPFTDAAGLLEPEMKQVNDLSRSEMNRQILRFFEKMEIDPTSRFDFSGEESKNAFEFVKTISSLADSSIFKEFITFVNALRYDDRRNVDIFSRIFHHRSLAQIADYYSYSKEPIDADEESIARIENMVSHYLGTGDELSQLNALRLCQNVPQFSIRFDRLVEEILESKESSERVKKACIRVREVARFIQVPERNYDFWEEEARKSGTANVGLAGEVFRGDPPRFSELKPFRDSTRAFNVLMPELNPELWTLQLDGPVNASGDEYQEVRKLVFQVTRGDVIVCNRRTNISNHFYDDWMSASKYLRTDLISDTEGNSGEAFDRQRFYFVEGVPKAQRVILKDGYIYEIRWIGRNYKEHPRHARQILNSFSPNEPSSGE